MIQKEWFEILPASCPPDDAQECNGTFYRIAHGDPATSSDFFSQRKMNPDKLFSGIDECTLRSISIFSDYDETSKKLKLPKFKKASIAKVELKPDDGLIKKTFGPHHYSWWRTINFQPSAAKLIK